ncbi:aminotransferase class I/II-fold pyridoxal phosphate-dependent enzyme [Nakamurella sp. YIM 132087]|uniref:Aminotransferase class I/II-fold pyridoxal phosphate-dependent enzyme n=1 Tax=Nakamurella alba TaxID=2665158 RepID=A0A7K1FG63_9ACTN|nr:aminotransferase class I/II-fold pyridoxal phosphate-dependent enzyme [Nakamurella alba]MTD13050.1 aminotransferase class I/II-fold pyridoxal phosphate-dependent enzyme [Nakamurella alba]
MTAAELTTEEIVVLRDAARRDYDDLVAKKLSLDLTRGKPSSAQLDLSEPMLDILQGDHTAADGTDLRNYGGPAGLPELRDIFGPLFQVPSAQLLAAGNSSLELMHDTIVQALLGVMPGAERRWADEERLVFLCPVPGYDRHFSICERFGIEMVPVAMTPDGPDMDEVERLVAADPAVKGIWCVPKYSNPDGTVYSDETVARLAAMPTAAPDFRIFWDNAYAVHHLTEERPEIADILTRCSESGHPDRVFVFGSTSKVTMAGGGVAFFGSSPANVAWFAAASAKRTIGPDKLNQLRHVKFLKDGAGVEAHMRAHAEIVWPKFEAVDKALTEQLEGSDLASWALPKGGYFVALQVLPGTASEVVRLAKEAGIALTPAGATHPYGKDPEDSWIRLAPTVPVLADVATAMAGVATCVRLAGFDKLLADRA